MKTLPTWFVVSFMAVFLTVAALQTGLFGILTEKPADEELVAQIPERVKLLVVSDYLQGKIDSSQRTLSQMERVDDLYTKFSKSGDKDLEGYPNRPKDKEFREDMEKLREKIADLNAERFSRLMDIRELKRKEY